MRSRKSLHQDGPEPGNEVRRARSHHLAAAPQPDRAANAGGNRGPLSARSNRSCDIVTMVPNSDVSRRIAAPRCATSSPTSSRKSASPPRSLRAKAAKPLVEQMITLGKRDTLHSRRQAAAYLMTPGATKKLFADIAPRFSEPRRRLYANHPRRIPNRRRRKPCYPRAAGFQAQEKGKERKSSQARGSRKREKPKKKRANSQALNIV